MCAPVAMIGSTPNIGDTVSGEIVEMVKRQQTSLSDGQKLFWDDGTPRMMLVITLATDEHGDDDDTGERTVYVRGGRFEVAKGKGTSMKDAIVSATTARRASSRVS